MKKFGIIDSRKEQYTIDERLHLISCLSKWSANLYIYGRLSWGKSINPIPEKEVNDFLQIADQCKKYGIELWARLKPGDYRYVFHKSDRRRFIDNAVHYLNMGADGFYLLIDDMHPRDRNNPKAHVREKDALYHSLLIKELYDAIGDKFKAICGEHYHGEIPGEFSYYWDPILNVLPENVMITWTGPRIWNKTLKANDLPGINRPLLLFENYFASDSEDSDKSPIYPYDGREPEFLKNFEVVVVNPNNHYAWQYCALQTTMDFLKNPYEYNPKKAFKKAIRDMGDMYMNDYHYYKRKEKTEINNETQKFMPQVFIYKEMKPAELINELKFMEWVIWRYQCWEYASCFDWRNGKHWEFRLPEPSSFTDDGTSLNIAAPVTTIHDHVKIVYPYIVKDTFCWILEISGDVKAIQLQASNGKDRLIRANPKENDIDMSKPQRFRIYRNKENEDIIFEHLAGRKESKEAHVLPIKGFHLDKDTGGLMPSIAVQTGGILRIYAWSIDGVSEVNSSEHWHCPECGGSVEDDVDSDDEWGAVLICKGNCGTVWCK